MAPEQHPDWRTTVRAHHAYRKALDTFLKHASIGTIIQLRHTSIPEFTLSSKHPLSSRYQGTTYRGTIDLIGPGIPEPGLHGPSHSQTAQQALENGHAVRIAAIQNDNG